MTAWKHLLHDGRKKQKGHRNILICNLEHLGKCHSWDLSVTIIPLISVQFDAVLRPPERPDLLCQQLCYNCGGRHSQRPHVCTYLFTGFSEQLEGFCRWTMWQALRLENWWLTMWTSCSRGFQGTWTRGLLR